MIHVCFGLYDKQGTYSKFTGTTMASIFENSNTPPRSITVHILHDNTLTTDNRDKFIYLAGQYNQLVKFYNVEELCADKLKEIINLTPQLKTTRLSIGSMYRLLSPQVLPTDLNKVIYLDSDIIVNLDIRELWQIEPEDKPLAAIDEIKADSFMHPITIKQDYLVTSGLVDYNDYFNAGVLLVNLNLLREEENLIMDGIKFMGEHPQLLYLDQEVLNYLFSQNYLKLDEKFNFFVREARHRKETECKRKIYHYAGESLKMDLSDPFNRLWMKYFAKTPWFNEETIAHLYDSFTQVQAELKKNALNLASAVSGKPRVFVTTERNLEVLVKNFSVREDEEVLVMNPGTPLQGLIKVMDAQRNKKFFFLLLPNFPFDVLEKAGFEPGRDFLNGYDFLSAVHGLPLNSYQLIKAM